MKKKKLILLEKDIMKIQESIESYGYLFVQNVKRRKTEFTSIAELLMSQDYITMQILQRN